jgi:hypothetical protein
MTHDGQKIDWKKILQEYRDNYTRDDSPDGNLEAVYQSESESFSQYMAENFPDVAGDATPKREDAETKHNVFDAISWFWEVEAPIPPELIATLLYLYRGVYLGSEREVKLEEVFFNHYGDSQYRAKRRSQDRDLLDDFSVDMDTQFEGLTKTEAAERRGEQRGVTGNAVLSNIRRKRNQREKRIEDK